MKDRDEKGWTALELAGMPVVIDPEMAEGEVRVGPESFLKLRDVLLTTLPFKPHDP